MTDRHPASNKHIIHAFKYRMFQAKVDKLAVELVELERTNRERTNKALHATLTMYGADAGDVAEWVKGTTTSPQMIQDMLNDRWAKISKITRKQKRSQKRIQEALLLPFVIKDKEVKSKENVFNDLSASQQLPSSFVSFKESTIIPQERETHTHDAHKGETPSQGAVADLQHDPELALVSRLSQILDDQLSDGHTSTNKKRPLCRFLAFEHCSTKKVKRSPTEFFNSMVVDDCEDSSFNDSPPLTLQNKSRSMNRDDRWGPTRYKAVRQGACMQRTGLSKNDDRNSAFLRFTGHEHKKFQREMETRNLEGIIGTLQHSNERQQREIIDVDKLEEQNQAPPTIARQRCEPVENMPFFDMRDNIPPRGFVQQQGPAMDVERMSDMFPGSWQPGRDITYFEQGRDRMLATTDTLQQRQNEKTSNLEWKDKHLPASEHIGTQRFGLKDRSHFGFTQQGENMKAPTAGTFADCVPKQHKQAEAPRLLAKLAKPIYFGFVLKRTYQKCWGLTLSLFDSKVCVLGHIEHQLVREVMVHAKAAYRRRLSVGINPDVETFLDGFSDEIQGPHELKPGDVLISINGILTCMFPNVTAVTEYLKGIHTVCLVVLRAQEAPANPSKAPSNKTTRRVYDSLLANNLLGLVTGDSENRKTMKPSKSAIAVDISSHGKPSCRSHCKTSNTECNETEIKILDKSHHVPRATMLRKQPAQPIRPHSKVINPLFKVPYHFISKSEDWEDGLRSVEFLRTINSKNFQSWLFARKGEWRQKRTKEKAVRKPRVTQQSPIFADLSRMNMITKDKTVFPSSNQLEIFNNWEEERRQLYLQSKKHHFLHPLRKCELSHPPHVLANDSRHKGNRQIRKRVQKANMDFALPRSPHVAKNAFEMWLSIRKEQWRVQRRHHQEYGIEDETAAMFVNKVSEEFNSSPRCIISPFKSPLISLDHSPANLALKNTPH